MWAHTHKELRSEVLRRTPAVTPRTARELNTNLEDDERVGRVLRCAACGRAITDDAARMHVNRSHEHDCVNPHGFRFHIGCFATAPGCRRSGAPTLDFTWFAGFAWSYARCGGCGTHLGWHFEADNADVFYGLIVDRLVVDADPQ